MLDATANPQTQAVVNQLISAGDRKIHYVAFPVDQSTKGCDGHPLYTTQLAYATWLAQILKPYVH
jgi:hypothetical protein